MLMLLHPYQPQDTTTIYQTHLASPPTPGHYNHLPDPPGITTREPCGSIATRQALRMDGESAAEMPHMRHASLSWRLIEWRECSPSRELQSGGEEEQEQERYYLVLGHLADTVILIFCETKNSVRTNPIKAGATAKRGNRHWIQCVTDVTHCIPCVTYLRFLVCFVFSNRSL